MRNALVLTEPINSETNVREVVWSAGGRSTHNNQTPQKTALLSEVNLCIDIQSMRDTLAEKVKSKNRGPIRVQ